MKQDDHSNTKEGKATRTGNDTTFLKFCGVLPKGEAKRMMDVVREQRKIDWEMW